MSFLHFVFFFLLKTCFSKLWWTTLKRSRFKQDSPQEKASSFYAFIQNKNSWLGHIFVASLFLPTACSKQHPELLAYFVIHLQSFIDQRKRMYMHTHTQLSLSLFLLIVVGNNVIHFTISPIIHWQTLLSLSLSLYSPTQSPWKEDTCNTQHISLNNW